MEFLTFTSFFFIFFGVEKFTTVHFDIIKKRQAKKGFVDIFLSEQKWTPIFLLPYQKYYYSTSRMFLFLFTFYPNHRTVMSSGSHEEQLDYLKMMICTQNSTEQSFLELGFYIDRKKTTSSAQQSSYFLQQYNNNNSIHLILLKEYLDNH